MSLKWPVPPNPSYIKNLDSQTVSHQISFCDITEPLFITWISDALFSDLFSVAEPKWCLFPVFVFGYYTTHRICFCGRSLIKPLTCIFSSAVYDICYKHKSNYADYVISYESSCFCVLFLMCLYVRWLEKIMKEQINVYIYTWHYCFFFFYIIIDNTLGFIKI